MRQLNGPSQYVPIRRGSTFDQYMPSGKNGLPSTIVRPYASIRTASAASSSGVTRSNTSEADCVTPLCVSSKRTRFTPGARSDTSHVTDAAPFVTVAATRRASFGFSGSVKTNCAVSPGAVPAPSFNAATNRTGPSAARLR